jgi:hypothetical protein
MEHTTTALPSVVPLLHRRQKYIAGLSWVCAKDNLRTILSPLVQEILVNTARSTCLIRALATMNEANSRLDVLERF